MSKRGKQAWSLAADKASKVEKKRKDVFVDVTELPESNANETIIQVSALDDLVRLSDAFFKPVLRKAPASDAEPWRYYVFDGSTRYEYLLDRQELSRTGDKEKASR